MTLPEFSLTETLFGGLLFAAVLFFGTRRLGLPNFWAGVLSGLLPFLAYLAYSSQHWAGGDVLSIHFVVYLANAGLLIVFGGMQRKQQKMHWAPRLIIAFFVGLVLINALFLSISVRGLPDVIADVFLPNPDKQNLHTAFPGVVPHDQNKSYQPHLERLAKQRDLGWKVTLQGLQDMHSGKPQQLSLSLSDREGRPISTAQVEIGFWRMANSSDDRRVVLEESSAGQYQGVVTLSDPGRWLAELYITQGEGAYLKQQALFIDN